MATDFSILKNEEDTRTFPAGTVIFAEDEPGDVMYAVLEGEVEIRSKGRLLRVVQPDGFFGEMALIDSKPRSATAQAKTDCKVACISEMRFLILVQHSPFFALHVMRIMAERMRAMTREPACD